MRTTIAATVIAVAALAGPLAQPAGPAIPACAEDDVVSIDGTCVHRDTADYRNGYWHESM